MSRRSVHTVMSNGSIFSADIKDGEVMGWQPITMKELNGDIGRCIGYLESIKRGMEETKEEVCEGGGT